METRRFKATFETRQNDKEKRIIGKPVVIGQETDLGFCREIIEPGALDKTDLRDVFLFTNHDTNKIPLARSRRNNGNSTMKIDVADDGINIDAILDTENNAESRALYSAIDRGDMSGMSFMFFVRGETWEENENEKPIRRITDIERIIEVSAVNYPAYPQTEMSVRDIETLDSVKRNLDKFRAERAALDSATESKLKDLNLERAKVLALSGR